jgi:outer membrane protein TolC
LNDPDIKKSALYVKTAEVKKAQSRSQYLPELSAFVDYGYYQPVNGQFFKQRNQWAGGLQLSWSLFDSLKREMKSKEASAYSKASKIALHYAQNRLNQTIQNDLETIAQALFVYYSTQKSLEVAEKMAEESRISYQAGRLSTYESQESTLFLLQSQLKYQESWAQVLKSYYQLLHDTGLVSELLL